MRLRKIPQRKHVLKVLRSQIKNIRTGLLVDQGIDKPDVVFVKLNLNREIWKRFINKPWKRKEL